ncbi:hypothetical protein P8452_70231 [Trifolium repens]|nr:hypothetical protein P8452_70231 [Trifolium repens]
MARKRKGNQSQKMRKSAKKMQPLSLDCSSISPSQDHLIGNASQHETAYQQGAARLIKKKKARGCKSTWD